MEISPEDRQHLESNIEEELSDYRKYMEQAQQTSNPQLARLWQMFAQDERRHAERQRAYLEMMAQRAPAAPTYIPPVPGPAYVAPVPGPAAFGPTPAAPIPPGFEWRGAPWPGPGARTGCCGGR